MVVEAPPSWLRPLSLDSHFAAGRLESVFVHIVNRLGLEGSRHQWNNSFSAFVPRTFPGFWRAINSKFHGTDFGGFSGGSRSSTMQAR